MTQPALTEAHARAARRLMRALNKAAWLVNRRLDAAMADERKDFDAAVRSLSVAAVALARLAPLAGAGMPGEKEDAAHARAELERRLDRLAAGDGAPELH
jgi:hypothetical protein